MSWKTPEPELYIHFEVPIDLHAEAISERIQAEVLELARREFTAFYEFECEIDVVVSEGSIKVRVKLVAKTVGIILGAYVTTHAAWDYFSKDIRWVQTQIRDHVLSSPQVAHVVSAQRRVGVIGRLDETLHNYFEGRISESECKEKLVKYLEIIAESERRDEYISELVEYLDTQYRNAAGPNSPIRFPWDDFENTVLALPPRRRKKLLDSSNKTHGE